MIGHALRITVFDAIVDPTRRHILELLNVADRAVGELALDLQMEQSAVSKHLRVLRDASVVTVRTVGRHRYYGLSTEPLEELDQWLDRFRDRWHPLE